MRTAAGSAARWRRRPPGGRSRLPSRPREFRDLRGTARRPPVPGTVAPPRPSVRACPPEAACAGGAAGVPSASSIERTFILCLARRAAMVYRTSKATQERKDARRRQLLAAAGKVFAARGYGGTSVKDIVGEAGVSVGTFYFYFPSKEEVFGALFDEMAARVDATIDRAGAVEPFDPVRSFARATAAA